MFTLYYIYCGYNELRLAAEKYRERANAPTPTLVQEPSPPDPDPDLDPEEEDPPSPGAVEPPSRTAVTTPQPLPPPESRRPAAPTPSPPKPVPRPEPIPSPVETTEASAPIEIPPLPASAKPASFRPTPFPTEPQRPAPSPAEKTEHNGVPRQPTLQSVEDRLLRPEGKPDSYPLRQPFPSSEDRLMNPAVYQRRTQKMVDAITLEKLESGYKKLAVSDSKSLLKKYLTQEIFDKLKVLKTPTFGSTLLDVIQSGLENHDSGVGIYAPDAEAYTTFADLFDPIIEDYHGGFKKTDKHPPKDFGDVGSFGDLDPASEYIISTRVRCGRSLEGYPFNPCLTEAQYKEMETKVSSTLSGLEGELKGNFYPLTGMTKEVQQKLIDDHFLFKEGDRFLQAANACRFWPTGRGIYHNESKTFLVWCNEEDHLRIISMQMGGNLGEIYRRLVSAVNDIEKRIPFSHNDRLGFLTFCPTNLGTTIRASVHIKVPKLAANKAKLEEVAAKFNLQVRGTRGEHTEAEGGVYDISNKRRMGLTEYQAVKEMNDGIAELIKIEKEL